MYVFSLAFPILYNTELKSKCVDLSPLMWGCLQYQSNNHLLAIFIISERHMRSHSRELLKCASCYGVQITILFYHHNDTFVL